MNRAEAFTGAAHVAEALGSRQILYDPPAMAEHLARCNVRPATGEDCAAAAAGVVAGYHLALCNALVDVLNGSPEDERLTAAVHCSDVLTDDFRNTLEASLYPHEECLRASGAGVYGEMSEGTKASYRNVADALASEAELQADVVLGAASRLMRQARDTDIGHVLIGKGQADLRASLKLARTPERPMAVGPIALLVGLALMSLSTAILAVLMVAQGSLHPALSGLLGIVAASLIFDLANQLYRHWRSGSDRPSVPPSLRADYAAVRSVAATVAFPVLIAPNGLSPDLLERISAMVFALEDTNIRFAILADFADSMDGPLSAEEQRAFDAAVDMITAFNEQVVAWGGKPIALLYRDRVYSARDRIWRGRGRKTGKVHGVVDLAVGNPSELRVIAGDPDAVRGAKYLLILDEDCFIDRAGILCMIAEASHPLNAPVIGSSPVRVVRGAGAIAPFTSRPSEPVERPLANLLQGPSIGPFARAGLRDSNFDLWGEKQFSGKGLIDVGAASAVLSRSIDVDQVLSHDYVEGSFLRCAFTNRAVVRDLEPASYGALLSRRERWLRGDFQNLFLMLRPRGAFAPLTPFGTFLILENSRRALFPVMFAIGLIFALSGVLPWLGSAALVALPLFTEYLLFARSVLSDIRNGSIVGRFRGRAAHLRVIHQQWLAFIAASPHLALLALICLARSAVRVSRRRHLLEWRVSSEVNRQGGAALWWVLIILPSGLAALFLLSRAVDRPITAVQLLLCTLWILAPAAILQGEIAGGFSRSVGTVLERRGLSSRRTIRANS